MLDLKLKATDKEARVFAVCQLLLAMIVAWWLHGRGYHNATFALLGFSIVVAIVGLIRPHLTTPLYALWMLAAFPIGWVMSYVVASIVYFAVITPIGLLLRVFGRDSMGRSLDADSSSYWSECQTTTDPKQYFRQF